MQFGSALTLITFGAILMFAVRAEPRVIDLDAVGVILVLVGGIGMAVNHFVWERRKEAATLPFTFDEADTDAADPAYRTYR